MLHLLAYSQAQLYKACLQAEGVTDDSLRDVTTVPENEILLPPLFPWSEDNTNNNNNIKSIRE